MTRSTRLFLRGLLFGAFALAHSAGDASALPQPALLAPAVCPSSPDTTLTDFPAYKYELTSTNSAQLDALANKIATLTKSGKPVRTIEIVGHAAVWGSSNYQQLSEYRAVVVQSELTSRFANLGIKYDNVKITTRGRGTECPVASNASQAGRAKNRRVEVWITAAPKPTPAPKKKKTTIDLLKNLKGSSKNPTAQCLIGKLLDPKVDDTYLPLDGLNAFMAQPIQKVGLHGYTSYEKDLGDWLNVQVKRFNDVPTSEAIDSRFEKSFGRVQDSLIDGIRAFKFLDCYDKRTKPLREHIKSETKKSSSLYSCPVLKALFEENTKSPCTA